MLFHLGSQLHYSFCKLYNAYQLFLALYQPHINCFPQKTKYSYAALKFRLKIDSDCKDIYPYNLIHIIKNHICLKFNSTYILVCTGTYCIIKFIELYITEACYIRLILKQVQIYVLYSVLCTAKSLQYTRKGHS